MASKRMLKITVLEVLLCQAFNKHHELDISVRRNSSDARDKCSRFLFKDRIRKVNAVLFLNSK